MRPDGGHVGNLVPLQSHGATSRIVKPIIVKKELMDSWKRRGHKKILPILMSKNSLFTFLRESNTGVEIAMCDCLCVPTHGNIPEETRVTGTLATDLNTGDEIALVAGRHDKIYLVLSATSPHIPWHATQKSGWTGNVSDLDTDVWCKC